MRKPSLVVGVLFLAALAIAAPAAAQRFPFERSYDVGSSPVIDVSTTRGKIAIRVGEPGRIVVTGAATVRVGLTTPGDAIDRAQKIAANPPIEQSRERMRVSSPSATPARSTFAISAARSRRAPNRARSHSAISAAPRTLILVPVR